MTRRASFKCSLVTAGTGKTATVLATINALRKEVAAGQLPDFSFIEINCLRLKSPSDACKCGLFFLAVVYNGTDGTLILPSSPTSCDLTSAHLMTKNVLLLPMTTTSYCFPIFFVVLGCCTNVDTWLWRGLSGVHLSAKAAHKRLLAHFDSQEHRQSAQSASNMVTICLVDELDYLLTKDFSVMYDFYSWPQTSSVPFIMIGIANTMDLPERLSNRYLS